MEKPEKIHDPLLFLYKLLVTAAACVWMLIIFILKMGAEAAKDGVECAESSAVIMQLF